MTYEEALYWCEQFEDNIIRANWDGEKMPIALDAIRKCKEALGKQITKKPLQGKTGKIIDGYCPNCCSRQLMGDIAWHRTFNRYCNECGQALDWSDGNENM